MGGKAALYIIILKRHSHADQENPRISVPIIDVQRAVSGRVGPWAG
jgi:hypothetical protein